MEVAQIRGIVKSCQDYTTAEITYEDEKGGLVMRTCFLDPFDNGINFNGFDQIPLEYRGEYQKDYPELPCLTAALSLDRNRTAYDQPKLKVLPRDVSSIELLTLYTGEDGKEFSNSVQIITKNHMNLQTVAGYLVDDGDLQRILRQEEIQSIRIGSFLEKRVPNQILTVEPVIAIYALVRNKQTWGD